MLHIIFCLQNSIVLRTLSMEVGVKISFPLFLITVQSAKFGDWSSAFSTGYQVMVWIFRGHQIWQDKI